jgi:hypothetical protein
MHALGLLKTENWKLTTASLVRSVRRAHVRVAQVVQHGLFVVAHAAGEVRIIQALIARRFRHVLQHAELLFHDLLTVPGHLAPLWQNVVLNMVALVGSQVAPGLLVLAEAGLLLRRHVIPLTKLLANLALLVRREVLKGVAVLQNAFALLWAEIAHGVHPRTRRAYAHLLAVVQTRALSIVPGTVLIIEIVLCRRTIVPRIRIRRAILVRRRTVGVWMILILRVRLRSRMRLLRLGRPIIMRLLRPSAGGKRGKTGQRQNRCAELEIFPHFLLENLRV